MNIHKPEEKTVEELKNELENLQIRYNSMFLATSLRSNLHDLHMRIQELKIELNKRNQS
jgi:chaperonin cofactor prefoldin